MVKYLIIILFTFYGTLATGQLFDDFDDGSFPSEPAWQGDTDNFMVNGAGQLQLMAPGAGTSAVYSAINLEEDTTTFLLDFQMDFNPSGSNLLRIYLFADGPDLATASGYYLQIGETGSEDAIRFFRQVAGEATELAAGTLGAVATSPNVRLRVDAYPDGLWSILADYTGGNALIEDILVMDDAIPLTSAAVHGYSLTYTAGRAEAYFFDNVRVQPFELDKEPPSIISAAVVSPTQIQIVTSEAIEPSTAADVDNYGLNGEVPVTADQLAPTLVQLTFAEVLPADQSFTLSVAGLADEQGNVMTEIYTVTLNYARPPEEGDVIINEIMFAALVDGEDYVELRNVTDDFLDLSGYIIGNNTKTTGATKEIAVGTVIGPRGYSAYTEKVEVVEAVYQPRESAEVILQNLPDFNNDAGNVYLATPDGTVLDSYNYDEDQHYELLAVVKGVSLERTSPDLDTNDPSAWYSASRAVNFGTPGYANSAALPPIEPTQDDPIQFVVKKFTPDGDNFDDRMVLSYELDKPGYIANIEIRDTGGFLIDRVKSNESLSSTGLITWDGLNLEGNLANIGMYIVLGELFHADGDLIAIKKVCVLAGLFD